MDQETTNAWQVVKQACEMVSTTRAGHVQIQQACEHVEKQLELVSLDNAPPLPVPRIGTDAS